MKLKKAVESDRKAKRAKASSSSFLTLSAELRNMVYEYALTDPEGVGLIAKTKVYRRTVERSHRACHNLSYHSQTQRYIVPEDRCSQCEFGGRTLSPALLSVNRQINFEASSILYKQELMFQDTMALHSFLAQIGPTNRTLISDVTLRAYKAGWVSATAINLAAFTLLASATNLESLYIDGIEGDFINLKSVARRVYRDAHHWFEGIGVAKGDKFAGITVLDISQASGSWLAQNSRREKLEISKERFRTELRTLLR
ncbi:hypothetical protein LTR50_004846 [Elasticomyces elasticus]|nr:hypothetical protein LTR50_004846 [Elasticomyces elasticus]